LYALLDEDDAKHRDARETWRRLLPTARLVTTSYVLSESAALVQARLGVQALRSLLTGLVAPLRVRWVDQLLHEAGVAAVLAAGRRDLSLVDCTSFELMRREQIAAAFAFDDDFVEQGFAGPP
jgi:uncharacterized protein